MRLLLLLALCTPLVLGCDPGLPDLRVERYRDGSVGIHLETLGEYPTSVDRLLLEDVRSGNTVWEVRQATGKPQLWKIDFRAGENPSLPPGVTGGGSFQVLIPESEPTYFLEPGKTYRITVWSGTDRSSQTVDFVVTNDPESSAASAPS